MQNYFGLIIVIWTLPFFITQLVLETISTKFPKSSMQLAMNFFIWVIRKFFYGDLLKPLEICFKVFYSWNFTALSNDFVKLAEEDREMLFRLVIIQGVYRTIKTMPKGKSLRLMVLMLNSTSTFEILWAIISLKLFNTFLFRLYSTLGVKPSKCWFPKLTLQSLWQISSPFLYVMSLIKSFPKLSQIILKMSFLSLLELSKVVFYWKGPRLITLLPFKR